MRFSLIFFFIFSCPILSAQNPPDSLIVGYTAAPPFIITDNNGLEGVNVWLWKKVAADLDIPYKMVPMDFSVLLSSLEEGKIDICINPLTITSERSKKMEFTHSFFASNSTIVTTQKSSLQKFVNFVKAFFNLDFLKGLFALAVIIFLFGLAGWYFERKKNPEHFRNGFRGIWDGVWWSAVTLTTVGYGDKAPKSRYGKIAALLLMFGGLLFISGLTASIASSLTVNELSNNPDSFSEFKDLKVGTVANSGAEQFLMEHFFKNIQGYPDVTPGLNDLENGKLDAFIYDEPILMHRLSEEDQYAQLSLLPIKFDVQFYAFGIANDRPDLEQAISQKILEIIEGQEWEIVLNEYNLNEL